MPALCTNVLETVDYYSNKLYVIYITRENSILMIFIFLMAYKAEVLLASTDMTASQTPYSFPLSTIFFFEEQTPYSLFKKKKKPRLFHRQLQIALYGYSNFELWQISASAIYYQNSKYFFTGTFKSLIKINFAIDFYALLWPYRNSRSDRSSGAEDVDHDDDHAFPPEFAK